MSEIREFEKCPSCGVLTDETIIGCEDCGCAICPVCACGDGELCEVCHERRLDEGIE